MFMMHWRAPANLTGGGLYLTTNWSSKRADVAGAIAVFVQS